MGLFYHNYNYYLFLMASNNSGERYDLSYKCNVFMGPDFIGLTSP